MSEGLCLFASLPRRHDYLRALRLACDANRVFEESDGQLKSISDEHDRIKASLSTAQSYKWDEVLDPLTSTGERNSHLLDLLGPPISGEARAYALLAVREFAFHTARQFC